MQQKIIQLMLKMGRTTVVSQMLKWLKNQNGEGIQSVIYVQFYDIVMSGSTGEKIVRILFCRKVN